MNIKGENDELLPVDDPIPGKDQQKQHKAGVGDYLPKVSEGLAQVGSLHFPGTFGFTKEQQHRKEHQKYAQRGHAKDVFHTHALMYP